MTPKPEADAPAEKYPRLVVCMILFNRGRVLLERRAPKGVNGFDNTWDLPGGKVECGETPWQAIAREMREELRIGVVVSRLLPEPVPSSWRYADGITRHWLLIGCICMQYEGAIAETNSLRWFGVWHLPEDLQDADRMMIGQAVEILLEAAQ